MYKPFRLSTGVSRAVSYGRHCKEVNYIGSTQRSSQFDICAYYALHSFQQPRPGHCSPILQPVIEFLVSTALNQEIIDTLLFIGVCRSSSSVDVQVSRFLYNISDSWMRTGTSGNALVFTSALFVRHSVICEKVNKFIASSRVYNESLVNRLTFGEAPANRQVPYFEVVPYCGKPASVDSDGVVEHYDDYDSIQVKVRARQLQADRTRKNHKFLVEHIKHMARNGMLQPFNRRKELNKISRISSFISLYVFSHSLVSYLLFVIFALTANGEKVESDPLDLLFLAEMSRFGLLAMSGATFYITTSAMLCLDQVHAINGLNKLFEECIVYNTYKLKDYVLQDEFRVYINPYSSRNSSVAQSRRDSIVRYPRASYISMDTQSTQSVRDSLFDNRSSNSFGYLPAIPVRTHGQSNGSEIAYRTMHRALHPVFQFQTPLARCPSIKSST